MYVIKANDKIGSDKVKIINLKNNENYLREYIELCSKEWGAQCDENQLKINTDRKTEEILLNKNYKLISVIGLINDTNLVGFISLLKKDGDERIDLTPWYGTMYVKKEFRKKGYSKILNDAILKEAKSLGYNKVYLKTTLINYYEKFGAKFLDKLNDKENIYYIEL